MSTSGDSSDEAGATTIFSSATRNNPVATDGRRLLAAFCAKRSVKYSDFKQSWLDMIFSFVYCAGGDQPRREEIVNCLYLEGLCYLASTSIPDHKRLAGLFLIYSVYHTQPLDPKILIRVTPEHWIPLMQLQEVIREKEYSEAGYILRYLRREKAFNLCCTSEQKCLCQFSGDHTSERLYQMFLTSPRSLNPNFLSSVAQDIQRSMEDYHSAKEERRVFFPQHLLKPEKLPQQLNKIVDGYNASVNVKLWKFRDSL